MLELRAYQTDAIHALRRSLGSGKKAPILVMPTGSGKTAVATEIAKSANQKLKRVVFLANRKQLVLQTSAAFARAGIDHGIAMSQHDRNPMARVQIASEQTLKSRMLKNRLIPSADLLIVDEAHMSIAPGTRDLIKFFGDIVRVGLTATPCRADGRGLGEMYDDLVLGPSVSDLTEQGFLAPAKYFAPSIPDLAGIRIVRGDYDESQLGQRMNTQTLVGDVVENWLKLANGRKTIVFAVNVAHSQALCEQFRRSGVSAEHLDGDHDDDERAAVLNRFRRGATSVLCNCMLFTYGFDEPSASCVVLARPTRSVAMYLQTVGRALRPSEGKTDCLVLDHAGSVQELGFVDDSIEWTLDDKARAVKSNTASDAPKERKQITCSICKHVFKAAPACPACGAEMRREAKSAVEHTEADLIAIERKKAKKETTLADREQFYSELLGWCQTKGLKPGAAYYKYQEKYGIKPIWGRDHKALPPSHETLNWIKSRNIAYAKRKAA